MRVGIISLNDPGKGLWRDTEILIWALQASNVRRHTSGLQSISVFAVKRYGKVMRNTPGNTVACSPRISLSAAVRAGTRFNDWLKKLDVLICNEVWLEKAFQLSCRKKVRVIYVPNLDCSTASGGTSCWLNAVRNSDVEVWAKTNYAHEKLKKAGIKNDFVPWSIPDKVQRDRSSRNVKPIHFLFIAGRGGIKNRRGLDIAMKAYALARKQECQIALTIHSVKPLRQYVPQSLLDVNGLTISEGFLDRQYLKKFHDDADVLLYPTRWDGLGLSLLEALHEGLPVLATDGQPMNEFVEHKHNGLIIEAKKAGMMRLTPHFECSPNALANAMVRIAEDDILRDRLTCPEPGAWIARQKHFCMRVQHLVQNDPEPRVIIFTKSTSSQDARRSEEYWRDALCSYGYTVTLHFYEEVAHKLDKYLQGEFDFILVSKVPAGFIKKIQQHNLAPVVLWHHDISDHSANRWRWFKEVAALCDLVAVPESGRGLFQGLSNNIIQVFPGAKVDGDRGPGRRPRRKASKWQQNVIVFLGQMTRQRIRLLEVLAKRFKVIVYGDNKVSTIRSFEQRPAIWSKKAVNVIRNAMMVLSSSMRNDYFYTSNRLFNSAGSGGCVLAHYFPGMRKLYPKNCLIEFKNSKDLVKKAIAIAGDRVHQLEKRMEAENYTWRHHTWIDRVGELLEALNKRKPNDLVKGSKIYLSNRAITYWNKRTQDLGILSSGYFKWNNRKFIAITDQVWTKLAWHLSKNRKPDDKNLFDFGCGAGRFLERLAGLGFNVWGADISQSMLNLANSSCRSKLFSLVMIEPYKGLPFKNSSINVLWSCMVLQHIHDDIFSDLISELHRILVPDGLVILFENTNQHTARTSAAGHVIFRDPSEYLEAFPGISVFDQKNIEGESHTIFTGRLKKNLVHNEDSVSKTVDKSLLGIKRSQALPIITKSNVRVVPLPPESQMITIDESIPRLTPANEVKVLCWLSQQIDGNLMEIGCNKGLTTRDLAVNNPDKIIYAVDYFIGSQSTVKEQRHEIPLPKDFCVYARELWNVICIHKNSNELNYDCLRNVKLIFIDSNHTYDAVRSDTEKALRYLRTYSGGLLIWHDYYDGAPEWIGVKNFVDSMGIEIEHIDGTRLALTKI